MTGGRPGARAGRPARAVAAVIAVGCALSAVSPPAAAEGFRLPQTAPLRVVTPFDPPDRPWLPGHRGVDLAARPHGAVVAPAAGVVHFAGRVAGRPVLSLDHGGGLRTTYEPVLAEVRVGDAVVPGRPLGRVLPGHPGCPTEACLHWGARVAGGSARGDDDEYVDPLGLLGVDSRPIRLKPLRPGDEGR